MLAKKCPRRPRAAGNWTISGRFNSVDNFFSRDFSFFFKLEKSRF
jgi:hypothetical protein